MDYQTIQVKQEDSVATIMLNRPQRRNGINEEMMDELVSALHQVSQDDSARVVVLTGAGREFCVGADVGRGATRERLLDETSAETIRRRLRLGQAIPRMLHDMEKPTIAMVNGVAAGGGMDFALACDIRIGTPRTRFRSFTQIGLLPGMGGAWFMVQTLGYAKAAEMLFSARIMDAQEALATGLLNRVVPEEELERETYALAREISRQSPLVLRLGKNLLRQAQQADLAAALEAVAGFQPICMTSQDHKEARQAFLEKRQPVFQGK